MIIIGSKAFLSRVASTIEATERLNKSDYDVIMSLEEFSAWTNKYKGNIATLMPKGENKYKAIVVDAKGHRKQYEIELGFEGTSARFLLDNWGKIWDGLVLTGYLKEDMHVLPLEYLLLTKKSHLIYPVHFEKNILDYHSLRNIVGDFELDETMQEYYDLRSAEAKKRYKQRTPKLNVTTEDFFSSKLNVPHFFVHDDIHEVMAHHDEPVYKKMQPDPSLAWCAKDMFFALPYEMQIQAVQEEAYVISLERYILPQYGDNHNDHFEMYKNAVKRICTTLTSGWFREFAIENYMEVIERYDSNFIWKMRKAIMKGEITFVEGKTLSDLPLCLTDLALSYEEIEEYLKEERVPVNA